jgi:uncharacterized membrane protein YphA (DoxX/SURF4 family)
MHESKARSIGYWITTSLTALAFLITGTMYLAGAQVVRDTITELGYPVYLVTLLGAFKLLGGLALLAPRLPRLKEWAYAGIVFNLIGAAVSHAAVGHPAAKVTIPLVYLGIVVASWSLRPASRRLDARREDQIEDKGAPAADPQVDDLHRAPATVAPSGV